MYECRDTHLKMILPSNAFPRQLGAHHRLACNTIIMYKGIQKLYFQQIAGYTYSIFFIIIIIIAVALTKNDHLRFINQFFANMIYNCKIVFEKLIRSKVVLRQSMHFLLFKEKTFS